MRRTASGRSWIGNTALLLILSLVLSLSAGGFAMAQTTSAAPSGNAAVVAALQTAGQNAGLTKATVVFSIQPTTSPFTGVWVDIFGPGGHDRSGGPQQVRASVYGGVYSIVYSVYLNVVGVLSQVATVSQNVYQNVGRVVYDVYLKLIPLPPNGGVPSGNVGTQPGQAVSSVLGSITTGSAQLGGLVLPTADVQVSTSAVLQGLQTLAPTTQDLVISVPASSIPVGGVVQVSVPPAALTAVANANKSLEVTTPLGDVALPPATLSQLAGQVPAGDHVTITMRPTPYTLAQQIQGAVSQSQASVLAAEGSPVQFTVDVENAAGISVGTFEPTNGTTVGLTLLYNNTQVTGQEALKLGVYRWDSTSSEWVYVGGKANLTAGTVTANANHLSTYAIFADNQSFPDIQGYWAQNDIELMVAHHVVDGMTPTSFDPTGEVTRAQFAAMVARALGLNISATSTAFSDVPSSAWFAGDVAAAVKAGIVKGYPDGTFRPNANITREEMAAMMVRAMRAAGQPSTILSQQVSGVLSAYADRSAVEGWAQTDLAIAIQQNIVKGMTPTTLVPTADASRAQGAVMIKRLLGYLGDL